MPILVTSCGGALDVRDRTCEWSIARFDRSEQALAFCLSVVDAAE
jgi:hypothetical protein